MRERGPVVAGGRRPTVPSLSWIATRLLLPPTLVPGCFGMNTKDLPSQGIPGGALWATGPMLASAGTAALAL